MSTQWKQKMKNVISEVFETMFYLPVDFQLHDSTALYDLESNIDLVRDHLVTHISLCLTQSFVRVVAANFLGTDEDAVTRHDIKDVMKEMANMIGGGYMTILEDGCWELGIPSIAQRKDACLDGLPISHLEKQVGFVTVQLDSHRASCDPKPHGR
jgi:hypothetical protein